MFHEYILRQDEQSHCQYYLGSVFGIYNIPCHCSTGVVTVKYTPLQKLLTTHILLSGYLG